MSIVLSFFVPGLGHMYNGRVLQGLAFMFFTTLIYVITIPLLCIPGFLLHLFVMFDAARDQRRKDETRMKRQAAAMASAIHRR